MVGIAGRSKGCVTCRKRRVKCDETHPECNRCLKAGRECEGYVINNFVDGLPLSVRRKANKADKGTSSTAKGLGGLEESVLDLTTGDSSDGLQDKAEHGENQYSLQVEHEDQLSPQHRYPLNWFPAVSSPGQALDLSPFRDLLYVTYTVTNFMPTPREMTDLQWMNKDDDRAGLSNACFMSLSTTFFGMENQLEDVISIGRQRYGKALRALNTALADPKRRCDLDVLKAIMALCLYEFMTPTNGTAWIKHTTGLERLFAIRGPEAFIDGPAHTILLNFRMTLVLGSLAAHQPSIFSQTKWKTIPWSANLQKRERFHYILDVLADCSVLVLDRDAFRNAVMNGEGIDREIQKQLIEKSDKLLGDTAEIFSDWSQESKGYLKETLPRNMPGSPTPSISSDSDDPLFEQLPWSTVYSYDALNHAYEHTLIHSLMIMLLEIKASCLVPKPASAVLEPNETDGLPLIGSEISDPQYIECKARCWHSAVEICRAVDYHLMDGNEGPGGLILVFPLRMVWGVFGKDGSPPGRWVSSVSRAISKGRKGRWGCAVGVVEETA